MTYFLKCRKCGIEFKSEKKTNFCADCKNKRNGITEDGGSPNVTNYGKSIDDYLKYRKACDDIGVTPIKYGLWINSKRMV